jgi:hypothetical protein
MLWMEMRITFHSAKYPVIWYGNPEFSMQEQNDSLSEEKKWISKKNCFSESSQNDTPNFPAFTFGETQHHNWIKSKRPIRLCPHFHPWWSRSLAQPSHDGIRDYPETWQVSSPSWKRISFTAHLPERCFPSVPVSSRRLPFHGCLNRRSSSWE